MGLLVLAVIYLVRALVLFLFNGTDITPQLFLAPRGLITILLFFAIPEDLTTVVDFQGVLLFVILFSCVVMTWALMVRKKKEGGVFLDEENTVSSLVEGEIIEE